MLLPLAYLVATLLGLMAVVRLFVGHPPVPAGCRNLSAGELAAIRAASLVTYPRGGAIEPSGEDAGIPLHVDRFVGAQTPRTRRLIRALFFAFEHATVLFPAPGPRGWRRFSSLTPEQQFAYLDGWRTSELFARRLMFTSLRAILTMGFFSDPHVLGALGLSARELES